MGKYSVAQDQGILSGECRPELGKSLQILVLNLQLFLGLEESDADAITSLLKLVDSHSV